MRNASPSLSALAGALASAQAELRNPEKMLTGVLAALRPGRASRSFRYASLSSGLEIARSALTRQAIALVQTTSIDRAAGCLCLQSALIHVSGEWISSDWPVCRRSDLAEPHRVGAAMSYARRYALFALIGIAGEDDLDAPDLDLAPEAGCASHAACVLTASRRGLDSARQKQANFWQGSRPKVMSNPPTSSAFMNFVRWRTRSRTPASSSRSTAYGRMKSVGC